MSIEERYDEVRQLIQIGKEKGYLLYDEVNEMLPSEITSSEDLDDLFNAFGSAGIEVVEGARQVHGCTIGLGSGSRRPRPHVTSRPRDPRPRSSGGGKDRGFVRRGRAARCASTSC